MSTCFRAKTRVAHKRHQCYFCGERIEKGERHHYRTGADGGDFWSIRAHLECDEATRDWDEDDYLSHYTGDMKRPMTAFDPCI